MRWLRVVVLAGCGSVAAAQTSAPAGAAPELSPQAAYDQAARPLDIVRRAVQNWSDSEIDALKVATDQAKTACLARNPNQYTGEDLLAYARLCAFAQLWEQVRQAATNYLGARNAATPVEQASGFPGLSLAFDFEVQASLRLKDSGNAFGTAQTMLRTVPYDDLASEATNATVRYVQLIQTDQALALLAQRQPLILALIKAHAIPGAPAPGTTVAAGLHPPLSIHELYADAIALPAMLQFANQPKQAAASYAELEAALPAQLSPDDAILTAASRRQYLLLGSPMPQLAASAFLLNPPFLPPQNVSGNPGAATVYILFPDWCAQCVAMSPQFGPAVAAMKERASRFYLLLASANPNPPAYKEPPKVQGISKTRASTAGAKAETPHVELQLSVKPTPAELLVGTPTLIVPNQTLNTFVATDFPLIIVTDRKGIVRYIQQAPDNALVSGGIVEQIVDRVVEQWSSLTPQADADTAKPSGAPSPKYSANLPRLSF